MMTAGQVSTYDVLRAESRVILETVGSTERRDTIQDTRAQSMAVGQPAWQGEAIVETGKLRLWCPAQRGAITPT